MAKRKNKKSKKTSMQLIKILVSIVLIVILFLALSLPHILNADKKVIGALNDYEFMNLDNEGMYTKTILGSYEDFNTNGKTYEMLLYNDTTMVLSKSHMEKTDDYKLAFTGNYMFKNNIIEYYAEFGVGEENFLVHGTFNADDKKFACNPQEDFPLDSKETCTYIKGLCAGLDDTVHQIFEDSEIRHLNKKAKE